MFCFSVVLCTVIQNVHSTFRAAEHELNACVCVSAKQCLCTSNAHTATCYWDTHSLLLRFSQRLLVYWPNTPHNFFVLLKTRSRMWCVPTLSLPLTTPMLEQREAIYKSHSTLLSRCFMKTQRYNVLMNSENSRLVAAILTWEKTKKFVQTNFNFMQLLCVVFSHSEIANRPFPKFQMIFSLFSQSFY